MAVIASTIPNKVQLRTQAGSIGPPPIFYNNKLKLTYT